MIDTNTISPNYLIQTTELSNDSIWEIEDNNLKNTDFNYHFTGYLVSAKEKKYKITKILMPLSRDVLESVTNLLVFLITN